MPVPSQLVIVSPPGSGTALLQQATSALGYTPRGTVTSQNADDSPLAVAPGEVLPLLEAAYGREPALVLIECHHHQRATQELQDAYTLALETLWRVWWRRLGQPVTAHTPLDASVEMRLSRHSDELLLQLLPGRDAWYVTHLDPARMDGGLLRHWAATGQPTLICHHRDPGDRFLALLEYLTRDDGTVGTLPEHLLYRAVLTALPTLDARLTYALNDPHFPAHPHHAPSTHWLRHHPAVLTLHHEDLTGPPYGGTTQARTTALQQLATALGHPDATFPDPPPGLPGLQPGRWEQHTVNRLLRCAAHMTADWRSLCCAVSHPDAHLPSNMVTGGM